MEGKLKYEKSPQLLWGGCPVGAVNTVYTIITHFNLKNNASDNLILRYVRAVFRGYHDR